VNQNLARAISPVLRVILARAGLFIVFASAIWALLPLTAPSLSPTGWPSARANNPDLRPSRRDVPAHDKLVELCLIDANGIRQMERCQFSRQYRFADAARTSFSCATTAT
jgi:Transmembrane secretion effector